MGGRGVGEMMEQDPRERGDIIDQLRELGRNLEEIIRKAWESDQGHEIREQFRTGLRELNAQVDRTVESIKEDEAARDLGTRVKDNLESAVGDEFADNLRQGVSQALKTLNEQINRLVESIPDVPTSKGQGSGDTQS